MTMTNLYHLVLFASTYGSGKYNVDDYNGSTTSAAGGGSQLSNTGVMIGLIVGTSALILLTALLIRIWRRPKRTEVVAVEAEEDTPQSTADDQSDPQA
jgi:hypothetical protein